MIPSRDLAASDVVRGYLVEQVDPALRRPGMYGGELAIRMLSDHPLFVEQRSQVWNDEQLALEQHGVGCDRGAGGVRLSAAS